jgi:hypothetical protein
MFVTHLIVEQRKDAWSPFLRDKLVSKAADQLRLSQDVALHRALEIALCSSRGELCGLIKEYQWCSRGGSAEACFRLQALPRIADRHRTYQ